MRLRHAAPVLAAGLGPAPAIARCVAVAAAPAVALAAAIAAAPAAAPLAAQDVLDRTPNIDGGWVGVPWTLHVELPHRFHDVNPGEAIDLGTTTTFTGALGLPWHTIAGVSYALQSPTVTGEPDEVELFARHRVLEDEHAFADLAVTAGWNSAATSFDAEALLARQVGSVRLLAAARWFSDARGTGDRTALAAGAVWHPLPRSAPIALAGDLALPLNRADGADVADGEDLAWSAGIQVGVPHTAMTISLQATNTAAATLQGASFAAGGTRYGFEMTMPVPAGYLLGRYPDREAAQEAVVEDAGQAPDASEAADVTQAADAVVEIRRYAYGPTRIVVAAGSVVQWVNEDVVVHTATAEDDAWDSGAIQPGEAWRARFDRAGVYPYYCGPHPFMKGVVIVQ